MPTVLKGLRWPRAGLLALLVLAGLALPRPALAAHDVFTYKVEQQVDLYSDEQDAQVSCRPGDHVLDGMWRVDSADQDDDDLGLTHVARSVDVLQAQPVDDGTYRFRFVKQAIGRVQAKVFITCLGAETDWDSGHTHTYTIDSAYSADTLAVPAADPAPWAGYYNQGAVSATPCPLGSLLVSPGFSFVKPDGSVMTGEDVNPGFGRMYRSTYADSAMRTWSWAFQFGPSAAPQTFGPALAPGGQVALYHRCLALRVDGHGRGARFNRHRLIPRYATAANSYRRHRVDTSSLVCGSAYKAMVAGMSIDDAFVGPAADDPSTRLWYLGMDPQLKSRVVRILDSDAANHQVALAGLCLNYRTT